MQHVLMRNTQPSQPLRPITSPRALTEQLWPAGSPRNIITQALRTLIRPAGPARRLTTALKQQQLSSPPIAIITPNLTLIEEAMHINKPKHFWRHRWTSLALSSRYIRPREASISMEIIPRAMPHRLTFRRVFPVVCLINLLSSSQLWRALRKTNAAMTTYASNA